MNPEKIEFLLCGSATDGFYSQAAMFRRALDRLGGLYRDARLVMSLDTGEPLPLPPRWLPYLDRIEFHYAENEHEIVIDGEVVPFADSRLDSYRRVDPDADLCFVCDADTLLLTPFDTAFLSDLMRAPALAAVIAHQPPPLKDAAGNDRSALGQEGFWQAMFQHAIGRPAPMTHRYNLVADEVRCPFFINYGLVAAPPRLLQALHDEIVRVLPGVRGFLDNMFSGQFSVAVAVESAGLPTRALPMRYNFPNRPLADRLHPDELRNVHLLHYQKRDLFDRQQIFASAEAFDAFMALPLAGSDDVFRRAVAELTGGVYPFPDPTTPCAVPVPSG